MEDYGDDKNGSMYSDSPKNDLLVRILDNSRTTFTVDNFLISSIFEPFYFVKMGPMFGQPGIRHFLYT